MNVLTNAKEKVINLSKSVITSKPVNKVIDAVSASTLAASAMVMNVSAADFGMTVTADAAVQNIIDGVSPFTEPAIIILCTVSGIRLGMRLLKGATF